MTYRVTYEVPPQVEEIEAPSAEEAESEIKYQYGPQVRVTRVVPVRDEDEDGYGHAV